MRRKESAFVGETEHPHKNQLSLNNLLFKFSSHRRPRFFLLCLSRDSTFVSRIIPSWLITPASCVAYRFPSHWSSRASGFDAAVQKTSLTMPARSTPSQTPSASTRSLTQEHIFRKSLARLNSSNPENPRQELLTLISTLLPQTLVNKSPILSAQREAVQDAITSHKENDQSLFKVASTAMDSFLSVRVHGARAKTSAFFDRLCGDKSWGHIAILAPSSVAQACFLALNDPRKRLTVIDVGPEFQGRAIATTLASQTGAPTRYAVLSSGLQALDGVDVLVLGAREVCINGSMICDYGAGALVQLARESGVAVIVVTQSVKYTQRMVVDWTSGGDVISPHEVACVVTEIDTAAWSPVAAPEVLSRAVAL